MKLNTNKCHLLLNSRGTKTMKIDNLCIKKLIMRKFVRHKFQKKDIEISRKVNALARLVPYVGVNNVL